MKKILIILVFLFTVPACSVMWHAKFSPKELPNAKIGQLYNEDIIITGVNGIPSNYSALFQPKYDDLEITSESVREGIHINIKGIPKTKDILKLRIRGYFHPGMFYFGSYEDSILDKTYTLVVED